MAKRSGRTQTQNWSTEGTTAYHRATGTMALFFISFLSNCKPMALYLNLVVFLAFATGQNLSQSPDGELICVSSSFALTVVEVKGSNSKLIPVSTVTSSLRPPRLDLHPSYNSLSFDVGEKSYFIIPDINLLRIIELKSQTEDNVQLPSCDPLLLRRFEAVPKEIWILCNPDGVSSSVRLYRIVYRDDQWRTVNGSFLSITSPNGPLLMDVGFIFHRNEDVYVALATTTEIVWFTPRTNVRETQSIPGCERVLQIAEFSDEFLLIECGQENDPSRAVQSTLLYSLDMAKPTDSILRQSRASGKIFFSDDRCIVGSVSADRIVMERLKNCTSSQIVPLVSETTNDIHDAFIETTNGVYTLVYARSGGGVYSYNITAALNGGNVVAQMIMVEEKVCERDCVGLLSLGDGFFAAGLSEPEGVAWFSISPPKRVGFASGAPSARLAFSPTVPDPTMVVIDEGLSGRVMGGIVGGIVGSSVILVFVGVVAMVAAVKLFRYRASRPHGDYSTRYDPQSETVHPTYEIQNNIAFPDEPQQPVPATDDDKDLPAPIPEVGSRHRCNEGSSTGSSQDSESQLVPGTVPGAPRPGANDGSRLGEALRVAGKEADLE